MFVIRTFVSWCPTLKMDIALSNQRYVKAVINDNPTLIFNTKYSAERSMKNPNYRRNNIFGRKSRLKVTRVKMNMIRKMRLKEKDIF